MRASTHWIAFAAAVTIAGLGTGCATEECLPDDQECLLASEGVDPEEVASADRAAWTRTNGISMRNGLNLRNGIRLENGVYLRNGINLSNGVNLSNGIDLRNGLTINGCASPCIAPISGSDLETWMAAKGTTMGLRILKYLGECALPSGKQFRVKYGGYTYTYYGVAGMAPNWQSSSMTLAEQTQVTACMSSRINGAGATIDILLQGPISAAGMSGLTSTEYYTYPYREAFFWSQNGGLFATGLNDTRMNNAGDIAGDVCSSRLCSGASACANCFVDGGGHSYCYCGTVFVKRCIDQSLEGDQYRYAQPSGFANSLARDNRQSTSYWNSTTTITARVKTAPYGTAPAH